MAGTSPMLVCTKCQYRQPDGEFCRSCGKPLVEPPAAAKGISRATVVRVVVVLIGIGAFYFFHKPAPPNSPDAEQIYTAPDMTAVGGLALTPKVVAGLSADDLVALALPFRVTLLRDGKALASGFLMEPTVVATTWHSIRDVEGMTARFEDGSTAVVHRVAAHDDEHDVAIATLEEVVASAQRKAAASHAEMSKLMKQLDARTRGDSQQASLGSASLLNDGDAVVTLGPAKGLDNSVYKGQVLGREGSLLRINIAVPPVLSGAALLNMKGEVVGLLTDRNSSGEAKDNYALPIDWVSAALRGASAMPVSAASASTVAAGSELRPLRFALAAHARYTTAFNTPGGFDAVRFSVSYTSRVGNLRVKILRGSEVVYDSGESIDTSFNLKLKRGIYTLVVENDAAASTDVELHGVFSPVP